mmetsp:Transcript_66164/g.159931  ORF Transcript_66164/g.159931 Transcript_66164/m.159931 type:complete len:304 (-) Transcript_66164:275-1186(-)
MLSSALAHREHAHVTAEDVAGAVARVYRAHLGVRRRLVPSGGLHSAHRLLRRLVRDAGCGSSGGSLLLLLLLVLRLNDDEEGGLLLAPRLCRQVRRDDGGVEDLAALGGELLAAEVPHHEAWHALVLRVGDVPMHLEGFPQPRCPRGPIHERENGLAMQRGGAPGHVRGPRRLEDLVVVAVAEERRDALDRVQQTPADVLAVGRTVGRPGGRAGHAPGRASQAREDGGGQLGHGLLPDLLLELGALLLRLLQPLSHLCELPFQPQGLLLDLRLVPPAGLPDRGRVVHLHVLHLALPLHLLPLH